MVDDQILVFLKNSFVLKLDMSAGNLVRHYHKLPSKIEIRSANNCGQVQTFIFLILKK